MMKRQKSDNLDRMLSSRLKRALGDDRRADWFDVLERAGMSRTLWRWSRRRVLLVAGVLVLAAGAAGASTGLIPWLNEKPKLAPPPKYPICGAKDVNAKIYLKRAEKDWGVPPGLAGVVILVNKGEGDCALEGQPKISLVGRNAEGVRWQVELAEFVGSVFSPNGVITGQTLLGRVFEPAELRSSIRFWWENWCGPGSGSDAYDGNLALRLEIANGSIIDLPVRRLPACNNSAKPSVLRFDRAKSVSIPPGAALRLRAQIITDGTGKPLILKSGKVFHYRIALTNMSDRTFRFGDCPAYFEGAWREGNPNLPPFAAERYVLNCRSMEAIDPGETVMFEMKLRVSEEAWNGAKGELEWILAPDTKNPPTARAAFVIGGKPSSYSPSDVYSAFAPGTQEATFPPKVELGVKWSFLTPSGRIVPGSRRILMKGSSWRDGTVYAWETESGRVCFRLGYRESCDKGEAQTDPIAWDADFTGNSPGSIVVTYVGGLARDGVKKVDVTTDGEQLHAKLENNAFYAKIPSGRTITAIVATMADASQKKVSTLR